MRSREISDSIAQFETGRLGSPAAEPEFLTLAEVANKLRVRRRTLERWLADGRGPPTVRVGGRRIVPRTGLNEWMLAGTTGGTQKQRDERAVALRPRRKAQSPAQSQALSAPPAMPLPQSRPALATDPELMGSAKRAKAARAAARSERIARRAQRSRAEPTEANRVS
jgi:excisionase family DNA binding protein